MAFIQGDTVANKIHADLLNSEFNAKFDPVALCVMEQFNKATFAQVPLRLTGNPQKPLEVDPNRIDEYKVGVSPLWRIGKKMIGMYLPMRFKHAEPFHAGAAWKTMEIGLIGMSSILAD
jgi:sulfide:quinone oxidoreductase